LTHRTPADKWQKIARWPVCRAAWPRRCRTRRYRHAVLAPGASATGL